MNDIKELAKWLEEEVEFLKNNEDYVGGWYDLGNGLAAVVLWEEGWGDEVRDDCIQSSQNPDWALCAGIMLINRDDTPDGWFMPWDSETGDILCETTGITPTEDYEFLAKYLLEDFDRVKDCEIKPNGETICKKESEEDAPVEEEPVEEESLTEKLSKGEQIAQVMAKAFKGHCGPFGGEDPYLDGNKLTLHSQGPNESWIFNDDGSVDSDETVDEFVATANLDDYGCETEDELRDYFEEMSHFDSVRDLFNSGLSWFMDVPNENAILNKIDNILKGDAKHEESLKEAKGNPNYNDVKVGDKVLYSKKKYNKRNEPKKDYFKGIVKEINGDTLKLEDDVVVYKEPKDEFDFRFEKIEEIKDPIKDVEIFKQGVDDLDDYQLLQKFRDAKNKYLTLKARHGGDAYPTKDMKRRVDKLKRKLLARGITKESLKEEKINEDKEFHSSPYHDIIAEYFEYDSDFEFLDVIASILGRVDDFSSDEDIWQAIDDELIYTYDQWTVLEHYCTPQDANWEVAFESLCGDVFGVCAEINGANEMKDDDIDVEETEVEIEDEEE